MMASWLLFGISFLGIGASFVYLNRITSRMKQGDGLDVIQNCRRLAWSWSAMMLGINGSDLAGRMENNPQASFSMSFGFRDSGQRLRHWSGPSFVGYFGKREETFLKGEL